MYYYQLLVLSLLLSAVWCTYLQFPPEFLFGASTSAYQIEGGWNASDKGENTYDWTIHNFPSIIADNSTGDVACNSYDNWQRDVQIAANLGLQFYRFSISWSRLLPSGLDNYISEDGVAYYNNFDPKNCLVPLFRGLRRSDDSRSNTGRYSHPIYSEEGGWPPAIEELMDVISKRQGFTRSRLPAFTKQEIQLIKGTYDFYGMNHYTSRIIRAAKPGEEVGPWFFEGWPDVDAVLEYPKEWKMGVAKALVMYPEGIRQQMLWIKKRYGDINILITENGFSIKGDNTDDDEQVEFLKKYMEQVLLSIHEDGVKVTGYSVWSLMDNFEWTDGYEPKFGLYQVDFDDPKRRRTPRKSAHYYAEVIKRRSLNVTGQMFLDYNNTI